MKRPSGARPRERSAPPAVRAPGGRAGTQLAWAAVLALPALLALWVHRGALGAYFTPDDLMLFERARGLVPWPVTLWRLVSGRLYYAALFPVFDTRPFGWHAVNLALHALNAVLVARWARRLGLAPAWALLAGGTFAGASSALTVVWQMSGVGELLACACALAGLEALALEPPAMVAAGIAFAAGLLAKENIVLVPLAALAGCPPGRRRALLRAALPALAAGALLWAYVLLARKGTGSLQGEAYAFGFGPHLLTNLRTYAAWSANRLSLPGSTTALEVAGIALLAAFAAAAWRGSRAAAAGLALWIAALLPVLPLEHHTYIHYLYVPLAGWCVAFAGALAAVVPARAPRALAWGAVAAVIAAVSLTSLDAMARQRTALIPQLGLPRDSFFRKLELARHVSESLALGLPPGTSALVILSPAESHRVFSVLGANEVRAPAVGAHAYDMFDEVLDGGRGLRALFPQLEHVRFAEEVEPADSLSTFSANQVDGTVRVFGPGPDGVAGVADLWMRFGMRASVTRLLESAAAVWPGDPGLRSRLAALGAGAP